MATTVGRWSQKRVSTVKEHIIGFLLDRNKWLRDWDKDTLATFTSSELTHVQYMEALTFVSAVHPIVEEYIGWTMESTLEWLKMFEGGLDAVGIEKRLLDLRKPFLKLTTKQVSFFIRRHIPRSIVEESINTSLRIEFKVNGYRKFLQMNGRLPTEWRKPIQGS